MNQPCDVAVFQGSNLLPVPVLQKSIDCLQDWVEARGYKGYEPFDGLSSWVRPLAFGNRLAERILQQAIRQSPINIRPIMGVRRQESTKGRGYMAWGYLMLFRATREQRYLDKATLCLEWLDKHKAPAFKFHSWSNHFDFVSRGGGYSKHVPIIVWTSLISHAYLEAFEITGERFFLNIADSACNWILQLPRERTPRGTCISYLATYQSSIHNANMLGASLLARAAVHTGDKRCLEAARSAMEYSCARQRQDGSWWYAEEPRYQWIDNFHTGYNLDSLNFYLDATGDEGFRPNLEKGLQFYKTHFFEQSGRPKYYHTRAYPIDIQCAAQSIDTLATLSKQYPECLELAQNVAAWSIQNMQDSQGYFYYRQYPLIKAKTPMLHWGQATTFKALANLLLHLKSLSVTDTVPPPRH